jgi:hypothetical protein
MILIRHTGAPVPQQLPPMHPECKWVNRNQILARAHSLRRRGELLQAKKYTDLVLALCVNADHKSN